MKCLIEVTTLSYRVRHAIAVEVSELYRGSEFAGKAESGGKSIDVSEKQRDITYSIRSGMMGGTILMML